MQKRDLELWWSSLPVHQKERIARKGMSKTSPDGRVDEDKVRYPACTVWWNELEQEKQIFIHDHCVDRHGLVLPEWNEGNPYGD